MGCPTEVEIGDNLVFSITTHDPDTGVLTDADAVPPYRIYEDETGTAILTGNMAKLDDANTTGFYTELIACTSGNGFENGKTYTVYIEATVDSDKGGICYSFKAYDQRKTSVTQWNGTNVATPTVAGVPEVDLTHMGGVAQSATDLKDFADAGYDPSTNKVQGVVLVDTTTTNSDMRGTDNAALASVLGALADAAADGDPTTADTVMQYIKQLVNVLVGTAGVVTFPAEAAPANAVSLAEVIRAIHTDVTGLNGDAMRGTDSAALASVCTEARLSELDAGTAGKMANQVDVIEADTTSLNDTKVPDTISLANINAEVDTALNTAIPGTPVADSINERIKAIDDKLPSKSYLMGSADADGGFDSEAKADVNTEVDNALDTALPASPTSGSINDILDRQEELIVAGSAQTGTLSTTEMTTDLTVTVNDQYNGRILTFRKDTTTAALRGQQTDITATTVSGAKLGFTALTTAPSAGDVFDIT